MAEDDNKPELRVIEGSAKPPALNRGPPRFGPPRFPSDEHRDELSKKGFKGRTSDQDLFWWHAYDYGWRRVVLQDRQDGSPIDPRRKWFNTDLAAEAEQYWSRKYGGPSKPKVESPKMRVAAAYRWAMQHGEQIPPYLHDSDPRIKDLVRRFEEWRAAEFAEQDRERAAAKARIIGDGKNPDGTNRAEAIAFVELCCRQIRANMRGLFDRSHWMKRMPDGSPMPNADSAKDDLTAEELDELAKLRDELGVKATEQKKGFE
jgi:hypothetical protein